MFYTWAILTPLVQNLPYSSWIVYPTTCKVTYSSVGDDLFGFSGGNSLTYGSEIESTQVDNTTNNYLGLQVQLEITHDLGDAAVDTFDLYISEGDDDGDLQSDATDYSTAEDGKLPFVGSLVWDESAPDTGTIRSAVFNIQQDIGIQRDKWQF